jgi:branched-chain amino acid transport system permease protein
VLGVPIQALFGQLLVGLINGAFSALLSLGRAVIFGLLSIIDFTHGVRYMMGAFVACFVLQYAPSATGGRAWWRPSPSAIPRRQTP